jgi:transposase InsO family protein
VQFIGPKQKPSTQEDGLLTENEFVAWCGRLTLSKDAEATVRNIRSSPPSRRVGGGRCNVSGRYPSRKMGFTIQFESHTVELPLVYQMEHDQDVLEYYCQPPFIKLEYASPGGRHIIARHTPDFFVLRRNSVGWVEAKSQEELPVLSEKSPGRYCLVGDRWECPPGKLYAQQFALCYEVHSSAYIDPVFVRNIQFLDDYLRAPGTVPSASVDFVLNCLAINPALNLDELLSQTRDEVSSDAIYQMIASEIIYIDLSAAPLIQPESVRVFGDSETASQFHAAVKNDRIDIGLVDISHGASLLWDGKPWTVVNIGASNISLLGENRNLIELPLLTIESLLRGGRLLRVGDGMHSREHPEIQKRISNADKRDLEIANRRAKLVQAYLETSPGLQLVPSRTVRRYISHYRKAKEVYGNGYIGLIPQRSAQGNRSRRFNEETQLAMMNFIRNDYETLKQPTKFSSWVKFKSIRERENLPYPSYQTYCTAIDARPRHDQMERRKGRRAAYQHKEFHWNLDQQTPKHGDRPFEIAHIDHTELDAELISLETGKKLHRAWLTIMTDAFSRRFLAAYLTFDEPSYRSCMMVLRECVRRYGRLPQIIVIDGGREFASTYFESVLAQYEVTKKTRPPAQSRFGSVCERLFGSTNTQFIHNLRGNTQIMKAVRQVTKSNNPSELAIWDIKSLSDRLNNYLYEIYDTIEHPVLGQSPHDAFEAGLAKSGARSHKYIQYDVAFLMATSPTTAKGSAKVFPGCGITINYLSYWSEAFRDPMIENRTVPVRYDPYNMGVAWAFVRGHWVECHSQFYSQMKGRTEKEVKIASTILRQQKRLHSQGRMTVTAKKIAGFLNTVEKDEAMLLQRLRDRESSHLREQQSYDNFAERQDVAESSEPEIADTITPGNLPRKVQIYGAL